MPPESIGVRELGPLAPLPYRVLDSHSETSDSRTIQLAPADGGEAPAFHPGQFNMVYAFGLGEVAISISGDRSQRDRIAHTVRSVGKISRALASARPGQVLGVRGPYGVGWPMERAVGRDVLVVAGGVGLAPLRPVLYELYGHRERFGRVEIIYGSRTPQDLLFEEEIRGWRQRTDARFQVTVDAAGREWYGDVGVATTRLPDARFDPRNCVAFVCGPEMMMRLTAQALEARGVPPSEVFLSMERNMRCAIGQCGHCQLGADFICRDGPVFSFEHLRPKLTVREL